MNKIIIRVAIIGVVLIGIFVFRDRLSGNAGELKIGDCFDVPAATTNVSDVQHHPCSEGHTAEVFFVGDHPAAKGAAFDDTALNDFLVATCLPAFTAYTGVSTYDVMDVGAFYPLEKDWASGERSVTCYLYNVDGSSMTKSLKAA